MREHAEHIMNIPAALYAAQVEDLNPERYLSITCTCGRYARISVRAIQAKAKGYESISDLPRRFRCTTCKTKSRVTLDVLWTLGWDRRCRRTPGRSTRRRGIDNRL